MIIEDMSGKEVKSYSSLLTVMSIVAAVALVIGLLWHFKSGEGAEVAVEPKLVLTVATPSGWKKVDMHGLSMAASVQFDGYRFSSTEAKGLKAFVGASTEPNPRAAFVRRIQELERQGCRTQTRHVEYGYEIDAKCKGEVSLLERFEPKSEGRSSDYTMYVSIEAFDFPLSLGSSAYVFMSRSAVEFK